MSRENAITVDNIIPLITRHPAGALASGSCTP